MEVGKLPKGQRETFAESGWQNSFSTRQWYAPLSKKPWILTQSFQPLDCCRKTCNLRVNSGLMNSIGFDGQACSVLILFPKPNHGVDH